ncbi:Type II secretion system protein E [Planctomycetes bacterium K2D]|uniref:Type II secretion system protein E n=2 Tax=Botrimarina mediterranea TaxID=2528022 RepID=A0A518KDP7_9BACT|nr:Type II secretion system protein E [Botrimarina mediterranea]QDV80513.1 Type II secretion system protein E [Planctomycetes bacterium K2D]
MASGMVRVSWRRAALAMAFAVGLTFGVGVASAQVGLGEVLETQNIRNEMAGGGRDERGANQANDQAADAAPPADGADGDLPAVARTGIDKWDDTHSIFRQREASLNWLKMLPVALLLLVWVRSADWINRDAQIFNLNHNAWNPAIVAPFVIAFVVMLLIPNYVIGIILLSLAWLVPFVAYAVHHNKSVEPHQSVFTGSWFRHQVSEAGALVGLKIGSEKKADYLRGPEVDLVAQGGDERTNQANLLTARQSPGYVHVKELVADMVTRGSARVLLDYSAEVVTARHMIDGVWHNGEPRDRESGDVMLAVMKQLANLNVSERRKKQDGEFGATYQNKKYACELTSQGVKTGERVIVTLHGSTKQSGIKTLEQLGMREKLRDQWLEIMNADRGLVVMSAMPEGGLTTMFDVALLDCDRLMRDFVAIEDAAAPETEIENVPASFYDAAKGDSPSQLIPSLSRKYPNVWVVRDFVDAETAKLLMEEIDLDRLVVTSCHAQDAAEACLRMLQKKTPHKEFARELIGVLNTRLIRKLCTGCRVEYEATPALLKKLGIPAGKVTKFYRVPKGEEIEKPCKVCSGLGYRGRTAIFELLQPDDQFRQKLLKEPKIDVLRKAARAAGMRTLQEEGILLVAKGVTSLQELQRVLSGS